MNKKFNSILHLLLAFLAVATFTGCKEAEETRVLKIAHTLDTSHPVHQAMMFLNDRLEAISGGKMRLEIYPSGQLGTERELIELLQIGALAMTKVSASPLEGFIPEMKVFSLPYMFSSNDHYWKVLNGEIGKTLLHSGEKYRVRGLVYYDAGSRSFYSTRKPIESPSDLSGMKIRVMNSQTAVATIKAMGGSPTPVSFGELYTALQQGVVDGAENNPPSFYLSKHYEVAKFYTIDEHTSIPDIVLVSTHIWNNLSAEEKSWLQQAADESVTRQRQLWEVATADAMRAVEAAGVEIITADKNEFKDRVQSIYQDSELDSMKELIDNIQRQAQ